MTPTNQITIRNRWTGAAIFTGGSTVAEAVRMAREIGANLRGADLSGADLRSADLRGANLRDAGLRDADLSGSSLSDANLSDADLSGSSLSDANLSDANLSDADLSGADLSGADLSGADLSPIRDDIWAILSSAPNEASAVRDALAAGSVDGSTYSGTCSCLVGTIATARGCNVADLYRNSARPAERFFMSIRPGHTPENSQHCALAHKWVGEWIDRMKAAFCASPSAQA
jgi:hypothetical protein